MSHDVRTTDGPSKVGCTVRGVEESPEARLGDTFISESVLTRPLLEQRLLELRVDDPTVAALFRVMSNPTWNWTNARGWSDPEWLGRGRARRNAPGT